MGKARSQMLKKWASESFMVILYFLQAFSEEFPGIYDFFISTLK